MFFLAALGSLCKVGKKSSWYFTCIWPLMIEAKFHILYLICCGERPDSKYKYNHRTTVKKCLIFYDILFLWKIAVIIWEMFIFKINFFKNILKPGKKLFSLLVHLSYYLYFFLAIYSASGDNISLENSHLFFPLSPEALYREHNNTKLDKHKTLLLMIHFIIFLILYSTVSV